MPKCRFEDVEISGVVTSVPKTEKCIDDEAHLFGGNLRQIERLKKTIGLDRRRVAGSGITAADLCESAARRLMERLDLPLAGPDAILCVTQTADYSQPCNAAVLHGRMDLPKDCAAFDVNLGCSGYVYGLWLAHSMIASGGCERVLLLAGDTISRLVHPKDRAVAPLFGDGGSATLVRRKQGAPPAWFSLESDGHGADHLIVPAGGMRRPSTEATRQAEPDASGNIRSPENLFMDGSEIFNFSVREEPRALQEIAAYAGLALTDVDYFVFHQANRYILNSIAKRLKLDPARVPVKTVERFGNQSSASIPCALCAELGESLTRQPATVLLSGFGVGLSWANAIADTSGLRVCEWIDHPETAS
ncbi:MAG: ketoacyl-ACP synthase III [Opitutales bacterium]